LPIAVKKTRSGLKSPFYPESCPPRPDDLSSTVPSESRFGAARLVVDAFAPSHRDVVPIRQFVCVGGLPAAEEPLGVSQPRNPGPAAQGCDSNDLVGRSVLLAGSQHKASGLPWLEVLPMCAPSDNIQAELEAVARIGPSVARSHDRYRSCNEVSPTGSAQATTCLVVSKWRS